MESKSLTDGIRKAFYVSLLASLSVGLALGSFLPTLYAIITAFVMIVLDALLLVKWTDAIEHSTKLLLDHDQEK